MRINNGALLRALLVLIIVGCIKEGEIMEPKQNTKAEFRILKDVFDDGETIFVDNISLNSVAYSWELDGKVHSNVENPSFFFDLNDDLAKSHILSITSVGADGMLDTFDRKIMISKRVFKWFSISKISEKLIGEISFEPSIETTLLVALGKVSEVVGWSPQSHILPEQNIGIPLRLPLKYLPQLNDAVALGNEEWYLRLSTRAGGLKSPKFLKEFRFNPSVICAKESNDGQLFFILTDDDMTVEIWFAYAAID